MKSKNVEPKKSRTIVALLLDSYNEFKEVGYPADPEIYFIRVNDRNKVILIKLSDSVLNIFDDGTQDYRFMGFKIIVDNRLPDNTVVFGPETIELKWNGD